MSAKKSVTPRKSAPRAKKNDGELPASLGPILKALGGKGGTARALAEKLEVSKPTIYAQLAKLRDHGHKFEESEVREGTKGPMATHFKLAA